MCVLRACCACCARCVRAAHVQLEGALGLGHRGVLVVQELLLLRIPLHPRVVDLQDSSTAVRQYSRAVQKGAKQYKA